MTYSVHYIIITYLGPTVLAKPRVGGGAPRVGGGWGLGEFAVNLQAAVGVF